MGLAGLVPADSEPEWIIPGEEESGSGSPAPGPCSFLAPVPDVPLSDGPLGGTGEAGPLVSLSEFEGSLLSSAPSLLSTVSDSVSSVSVSSEDSVTEVSGSVSGTVSGAWVGAGAGAAVGFELVPD